MGWWIYFIIVWLTVLLLVPLKEWKRLFIVGIIGMLIVVPIDSILISFNAIRFHFRGIKVLGLPLPYWLSYFPGGVLFAYFRPVARLKRLLYIPVTAVMFVIIEFITIQAGIFQHVNWNLFNAAILNTGGFTILLWFTEWFYSRRKECNI